MLGLLFLAATPLAVSAYRQEQTPLVDHGPKFSVPIQLGEKGNYYFRSTSSDTRPLELQALEDIVSYGATDSYPHAISIHIPADPSMTGTMSLIPTTSELTQHTARLNWVDSKTPGDSVPVSHVGIRKGAAISEEIYSVRLALETPYILIPSEIYQVLEMATHPKRAGEDLVVDCGKRDVFPDLFIGLDIEAEDVGDKSADVEDRELVITPSQYILESEPGNCILLAKPHKSNEEEEVVLGWAAIRGKHVMLDWVNERTGFEA